MTLRNAAAIGKMTAAQYLEYLKADAKQHGAGKKPRKKPVQHEEKLQVRIMQSVDYASKFWKPIGMIFHIPNGKKRGIVTAVQLKKMGTRRGIPDLFFPYPSSGLHGLWIELKVDENGLSEDQEEFRAKTEYYGYGYAVVKTIGEFWKVIFDYTGNDTAAEFYRQYRNKF